MNQPKYETLRCRKCLMPSSAPGIHIENNGTCNICMDYQPEERVKGDDSLLKLLRNYSNISQPYDCIVPISGGIDSFYTAFYLKNKLRLKCLGVNYDTGLSTKSSATHLAWVEEELEIPIVYNRIKPSLTKEIVCNSVRSLINFGPKYMQAALCRHCGFGIRASVYREMVIRELPSVWGRHTMDTIPFRYCRSVSTVKYLFQKNWYYAARSLLARYKQSRILRSPGFSILNLLFTPFGYPDISKSHSRLPIISFFKYVQWDKNQMIKELDKSGIDTGLFFRSHSDCKLAPIVDRVLKAAWTVGKEEVYISNRIRAGQLTTEKGAEMMRDIYSNETDTSILTEIGLNSDEIDKMFVNF